MPRPPRNFLPGHNYLVSQQGNKQNPICVEPRDQQMATKLLRRYALRYKVDVIGSGWRDHDACWLLRPATPTGISNLMRDLLSAYSRYLNGHYRHLPCCAQRERLGLPACHAPKPIRRSSNWTPRFRAVEIAPGELESMLRVLRSIRPKLATRRPVRRWLDVRLSIPIKSRLQSYSTGGVFIT